MKRKIIIEIDADAKTCGNCTHAYLPYYATRCICNVFNCELVHRHPRQDVRLSVCLSAEKQAETNNQ